MRLIEINNATKCFISEKSLSSLEAFKKSFRHEYINVKGSINEDDLIKKDYLRLKREETKIMLTRSTKVDEL